MMASAPPTGAVGRAGVAGTVSASAGGSGSGSRFSKSASESRELSAGASVIIWGVARVVIMMSTVTPAMIMLVLGRRRFGQRIAHVLRDRLACVIPGGGMLQ
jgi:hypothetical protein